MAIDMIIVVAFRRQLLDNFCWVFVCPYCVFDSFRSNLRNDIENVCLEMQKKCGIPLAPCIFHFGPGALHFHPGPGALHFHPGPGDLHFHSGPGASHFDSVPRALHVQPQVNDGGIGIGLLLYLIWMKQLGMSSVAIAPTPPSSICGVCHCA